MRELEVKEKKIKEIQSTGDRLLREGHPARPTVEVGGLGPRGWEVGGLCGTSLGILVAGWEPEKATVGPQSFQAALQTQWSWMLQLCCCIEAHLKENTAYFQVRRGPLPLHRSSRSIPGAPDHSWGGRAPSLCPSAHD